MKSIKQLVTVIFIALSAVDTQAQQEPMISQYMTNGLFLNPAYAGSHPYTTVSALYRKQWMNFPGAPTSAFITLDKRFYDAKVGLGITYINDKIGVSEQNDFAVNYSYHILVGKGQLAMGLKGTISNYRANLTDLKIWDANDKAFADDIADKWVPNFGMGAYYYTDDFYVGLSVPHMLNYTRPSEFLSAQISKVPAYERHYFLASGYVIHTGENIALKPSVLVKYVPDAPVNADINFNAFYRDFFSLGASYRTDGEVVALFEMNVSRRLRFGYAYDIPLNQLNNHSNGTHEVMMAYDFGENVIKVRTPRFF